MSYGSARAPPPNRPKIDFRTLPMLSSKPAVPGGPPTICPPPRECTGLFRAPDPGTTDAAHSWCDATPESLKIMSREFAWLIRKINRRPPKARASVACRRCGTISISYLRDGKCDITVITLPGPASRDALLDRHKAKKGLE